MTKRKKVKVVIYMTEEEIIQLDIRAGELKTSRSDLARSLILHGLYTKKQLTFTDLLNTEIPNFAITNEEKEEYNKIAKIPTPNVASISIESPNEIERFKEMLSGIGKNEEEFVFNPSKPSNKED